MLNHKFILCLEIPKKIIEKKIVNSKDYSENQITMISDDFILENHIPIRKIKMYNPYLDETILGLAYHGTTIIDNIAANELRNELLAYCKDSDDLRKMIDLLDKAIEGKKYIIHFGI